MTQIREGGPPLTALTTPYGTAYYDVAEVVGISTEIVKAPYGRSRKLTLRGGATEYITSDRGNFDTLRALLPAEAEPWGMLPQNAPQGPQDGADWRGQLRASNEAMQGVAPAQSPARARPRRRPRRTR